MLAAAGLSAFHYHIIHYFNRFNATENRLNCSDMEFLLQALEHIRIRAVEESFGIKLEGRQAEQLGKGWKSDSRVYETPKTEMKGEKTDQITNNIMNILLTVIYYQEILIMVT